MYIQSRKRREMSTYDPARYRPVPRKNSGSKSGWWSEAKKIEACTIFIATGSPTATAAATGVPIDTIRKWREAAWWKELREQIQHEDEAALDSKTTKIIQKTMDLIADRVENGEYLFDQKTGTIKRMPMSARTATKVASDLFDKRQILRKQPTKIVENHNIADRINQLASEFAKFSAAKTIEGTVIPQEKEDAS